MQRFFLLIRLRLSQLYPRPTCMHEHRHPPTYCTAGSKSHFLFLTLRWQVLWSVHCHHLACIMGPSVQVQPATAMAPLHGDRILSVESQGWASPGSCLKPHINECPPIMKQHMVHLQMNNYQPAQPPARMHRPGGEPTRASSDQPGTCWQQECKGAHAVRVESSMCGSHRDKVTLLEC